MQCFTILTRYSVLNRYRELPKTCDLGMVNYLLFHVVHGAVVVSGFEYFISETPTFLTFKILLL